VKPFVTALNVLTVVLLVAACAVLLERYDASADQQRAARLSLPIDFNRADRTLVIVVQKGCASCENSLGFFQDLIVRRNLAGAKLQIALAAPRRQGDVEQYLASHGVKPDVFIKLDARSLPMLRVVPALLVTDRTRRVLKAWEGNLSIERQQAVANYLGLT
jgi:hypothetical protein